MNENMEIKHALSSTPALLLYAEKGKRTDNKELTPSMIVSTTSLYANNFSPPGFISLAIYIEFKIVWHLWEYIMLQIPEFEKYGVQDVQKYNKKD